ncbi:MAG: M1 family metallopeptidase [Gemmatimonadetes bacterium]|nr:M1 family metallopeptidase [Gemmatimonadota bacterium]
MHPGRTAQLTTLFVRPSLALLLATLPAATAPLAAQDGPSRPGIDIEAYRFELALRDDTDEIAGRATVTLRFTADGVTEVPLDLIGRGADGRGMEVLAVTDPGGGSLVFSHESDLLTVTLAEPGAAGERATFSVGYAGVPASGLRIGPNKYGERTFFSDNWPNRARNWLPTVDHIGDKATNEFIITAPAHYQVVSNGRLVEETDLEGGMRLTHWRQSVPIPPWLYVVGVARFAVQHLGEFKGVPVQTWVYARDRDAGFYDFAVPTMEVLHFYDAYVGPFAYEKLANITSPATGGGMEAATALMYGENSVTGERSVRWRNVIIHEIAHQWFGNSVTESTWDDVWLSEGFATYFTLLFREHAYGRDDFVTGLREAADRVWRWYDENPDYRIVHDNLTDMSRVTSVATYQKGAWVLHMLRSRLGDEAFWRGIRLYYARHFNETATTDDFMRAMEEVSGDDLQRFFDQWLRQGGNPRLAGSWRYDGAAGAVEIELRQVQEVGRFNLSLEIGVYVDGDLLPAQVVTVEVGADADASHFTIPIAAEPADVRLDPGTRALFRAEFGRADTRN